MLLSVYLHVDFSFTVVGQTLRTSSDPQRRGSRVDPAGAEGEALPGDHLLSGQRKGER